jgi:hypothetical protein
MALGGFDFLDLIQGEAWIAPAVGVGCALVAILLGRWLLGDRRREAVRRPPMPRAHGPAAPDPFIHGSAGERRASLRRGGNPVAVLISDAETKMAPFQGWVLDRSMGGLCLSVDQEVSQGTVLSVRAANAPANVAWVQVEVKNCRQEGDAWELGCQFLRTPTWGVLLLFG